MIKTENVHEGCVSRAALIERVEGMTCYDYCENDGKEIHWRYRNGYNQALDHILIHLRGEESEEEIEYPNPYEAQEETECECACHGEHGENIGHATLDHSECRKPRTEETEACKCGMPGQRGIDHKSDGCYWPPVRVKNYSRKDAIPMPEFHPECGETEKEGASFSGRRGSASIVDGKFCLCGGEMAAVRIEGSRERLRCTECELTPKETPTPQSREQGGEKKCCGECVRFGQHRGKFALTDCRERSCKCHQTNQ